MYSEIHTFKDVQEVVCNLDPKKRFSVQALSKRLLKGNYFVFWKNGEEVKTRLNPMERMVQIFESNPNILVSEVSAQVAYDTVEGMPYNCFSWWNWCDDAPEYLEEAINNGLVCLNPYCASDHFKVASRMFLEDWIEGNFKDCFFIAVIRMLGQKKVRLNGKKVFNLYLDLDDFLNDPNFLDKTLSAVQEEILERLSFNSK